MNYEFIIYLYLLVGFILGLFDLRNEFEWAEEKYPFTKKEYLKSLPNTFRGFMTKILISNVLGFVVIISLVIWCFVWPLHIVELVIGGKK